MASVASTNSTNSRFQDRTVFITGAAHGMGRAHALAFAREGARLVLCDACRQYSTVPYPLAQPEELASLTSEIEQMGRPVLAAHVDVTDLAAMQALAERAQRCVRRAWILPCAVTRRYMMYSRVALVHWQPTSICWN